MAHVCEHVTEGVGVAGHLEADVEALGHMQLGLHLGERGGGGIDGAGDTDFFGQLAAVGVGVGDDDVAGAGVAGDGGSHNADGAGAGDEHVLAEHREGERGVDGVAEGIEDGSDFGRDAGGVMPDVRHGQDDELREGAVARNTDAAGVGAEMAASGEAVAAASADDVTFAADELAGRDIEHIGADRDDFANELMADDQADGDGLRGPGVPVEDVEIGSADAGEEDADFDVVDAHFGLGNVLEPKPRSGFRLDQCLQYVAFPGWTGERRACPSLQGSAQANVDTL